MYEFLDHPSEAMVRVTGNTIDEIFADAAKALFELMTDTNKLHGDREFHIELESTDRALLLIDWLNRLILLHEIENVFLCEFQVKVQPGWTLSAKVKGQTISLDQEKRLQAKSATYGQLQWSEMPQGQQVQFVIDV